MSSRSLLCLTINLFPLFTCKPAASPYSDLPADWRAPLPPREFKPKKGEGATEEEGEGRGGGEGDETPAGQDGLRTPAEVLQEATRVTPSGKRRMAQAQAPPGVESFQTENQRRRALPLSQLKRAKPKKRCVRSRSSRIFSTSKNMWEQFRFVRLFG